MSYYPPPPGLPYQGVPNQHPQSTTVLVLGILSVVVCGLIGPFAWVMGNRVLTEIDSSGQVYSDRGQVKAGQIMGIIGTVLLAVSVVIGIVVAIAVISAGTAATNY